MSPCLKWMRLFFALVAAAALSLCFCPARAQSTASGTVAGTVLDPSGAVIPGAAITLTNPIRQFQRSATTDVHGVFRFNNVPPGSYELIASAKGFSNRVQSLNVQGIVPMRLNLHLGVAKSSQVVTVRAAGAVVQTVSPQAQTNVSRTQISELSTTSPGSGLASLITLTSPSVVADSNGFFHPLGDHAEQTFVVDGEPNSDQQSKLFSTAIPADAVQSMDLVTAMPSAEYGDKTAMVVQAVTRSGLGTGGPHGSFDAYYGSFGTLGENATLSTGGDHFGNFMAFNSVRSGRFMDSPEFTPLHDIGNHLVGFDRLDYQPNSNNSYHLDLEAARNWFQIPNTFVQQSSQQDQRQQVITFNLSPSYQHIFGPSAVITVNPWIRRDHVNYYPSNNPFNDQPATLQQSRYLTNWGGKVNFSYSGHDQNLLVGTQDMQTRLSEAFQLGLADPLFNAVCVDSNGNPIAAFGIVNPANCASVGAGDVANPSFSPGLLRYDLTRGGSLFRFNDRHNINEYAGYVQDDITLGNFVLNGGLRLEHYVGLVTYTGIQPRVGGSYKLTATTVLRASYSRSYESPYNENLLLSSATGAGGLANNVFGAYAGVPLQPGTRNTYDVGLQQNVGGFLQIDGDYFWKYTQNAFDFDTLFNTPITFPITWAKSKIDGFGVRFSTVDMHGFRVNTTMGHTRSRFFGPENGGIIFNSPLATGAFRIDHDQEFQQTTNLNYRHGNIWMTFTWNYESGLVAGAVPDLASVLGLNGDQQAQIGFYCGSQVATLSNPITSCSAPYPQWGATRVNIPAPGTENDDTNPPRIAPRNLFDASVGDDNVLRTEAGQVTLRLTATNLFNKEALYNFLSTFSGTHFVSPRDLQLTLGLNF